MDHASRPTFKPRLAFSTVAAQGEAMIEQGPPHSSGPLKEEEHPPFARVFRDHYPDLMASVRRRVGTDAEAADIAQEAYLRILRYRDENDLTRLRMLLYKTAANLIGMRARVARTHHWADHIPLDDDLPLVAGNPPQERELQAQQQLNRLMAAIEKFPRKCRQAFLLRRFYGLSLQETADRMRVSTKAVEKHITTALTLLQKKVGSDWP